MRSLKLTLFSIAILLMSTQVAFASAEQHALPWGNFLYRIITAAGFVGILTYFFGAKIKAFFKARTDSIAAEISSLENRKVVAQQNLADVEKRIANLEAERQTILRDYRAQGEAIKAEIVAQAEKTARQMAEQAQKTANYEIDTAITAMRAEMAEKIVEATEKLLQEKLSAEEHSKLIDKYLTKVVLN
ncbi:F0F1 ATP synthase subunit B family protein [Desulfovibrio cuneatus]|uniref:F0F1 ATP synthase subunit B family protein n=1 Tax=Desulfovibrio cuneatus TaxID=159728 RepID=UPI00041D004D|nr:ATP synthase F0 subunit B [Desulfovibrio cuneatus]